MFQTISQIADQIIKSIQNTGIVVAKTFQNKLDELKESISSNTYSVEVKNPQTKVEVKGTVIVANQLKLEKKLEELKNAVGVINKNLPALKKVEVTNQKAFPDFPKEIKVNNLSSDMRVSNLNMVVDAVDKLNEKISKLKLNPEIKVEAPKIPAPIVNVPKQERPIVNITEKEVDLSALKDLIEFWQSLTSSAKKSISVRLSDGKAFYKAMDKIVETVTANNSSHFQYYSGGEARPIVNRNNELQVTISETWDINNSDKVSTSLEYIGEENVGGKWRIREITKSGNITTIGYASVRNNSTISDYNSAWEDRTDLVFGRSSEI